MEEIIGDRRRHLDPSEADTAAFWSIWGVEPGLEGIGIGVQLILGALDLLRAELPGIGTCATLSPVPGFRSWNERQAEPATDGPARLRACARYLTSAQRGGPGDGRLLDPVARFHLGNGARLWRLNPDADTSERGRSRAYGIMANYRYAPEDLEANRESLAENRVATSPAIDELLRPAGTDR
jgi:malonyl-CoA decarboxylase